MGSMVIIEVRPFFQLRIEEAGVIDHHASQHLVELFLIDPVSSLHFSVQPRSMRPDIDMIDPLIQYMPMEYLLKFR